MRSQTLTEFAEDMRRKGDIRQSDLADEILTLIDIESDVAEPYSELTDIIEGYAEDFSNPTDDQVKALLEIFAKIRDIIGVPDEATDEDVENAIQDLADRAQPLEYDL